MSCFGALRLRQDGCVYFCMMVLSQRLQRFSLHWNKFAVPRRSIILVSLS